VYVPKDEKLRVEIIQLHHDMPIAGHGGQWKTIELVTRNYWWPGVMKEVKRYVEECNQCQRIKNRAEMPAGKLRPNQVPECYDSMLKVLSKELTLVLSNTRELDRVPSTE